MQERKIAFCFTQFEIINELGIPTGKIIDSKAPKEIDYNKMLCKRATFGCSTVMIDLTRLSNFSMSTLKTGQDYVSWLSILKKGIKAYLFDLNLSEYSIVAEVTHPRSFQSPDIYHHWCCDLHPRFHKKGYSFNFIFDNKRSLCIAPLNINNNFKDNSKFIKRN